MEQANAPAPELDEATQKNLEFVRMLNERGLHRPWETRTAPFHIVGDIYFVGTDYVSLYLIDTGDGLALIDCSVKEAAYLLFDSIYRLGFRPQDIRWLLLTHAHFDHCGAARLLQEHTGCQVFLGEPDWFFLTDRRDLICYEHLVPPFRVDQSYPYGQTMELGGVSITPVLTPGHTPGTTSFFIETRHEGKPLRCGLHGGVGINGLSKAELARAKLPPSLQTQFRDGLIALSKEHVDVVLASHANHYDIVKLWRQSGGDSNAFINPQAWQDMLAARLQEIERIL